MGIGNFIEALGRLTADEVQAIADQLRRRTDSAMGEIGCWRAQRQVERTLERRRCLGVAADSGRQAANAVRDASVRSGLDSGDRDVVRVARAARDAARALVAQPSPARQVATAPLATLLAGHATFARPPR